MPLFYYLYFAGISFLVRVTLRDKRGIPITGSHWGLIIVLSLIISIIAGYSLDHNKLNFLHDAKIFILLFSPICAGVILFQQDLKKMTQLEKKEKYK